MSLVNASGKISFDKIFYICKNCDTKTQVHDLEINIKLKNVCPNCKSDRIRKCR
jgi:Zn finger protein HypA/HybF involved in hydrogenase expression